MWEDLILTPEYDFLRTDPHLGQNIFLLGLGGSHAYGTNVEGSDVDIRGVALNSKDELLSTELFDQVVNNATDTTIYSFNKFIKLILNCNPNTIELLGLKPEHYIYKNLIGDELLNNSKLFLSKKCVGSFCGYANQHLYRLNQIGVHKLNQDALEQHILKTLNNLSEHFSHNYNLSEEDKLDLYIDESSCEDMNTEIFMNMTLKHYPLRDYLGMWNELKTIVKSYNTLGKRNDHALEHNKISKQMMHLIRLYLMGIDILEKEQIITYRESDLDLLMEIRNGRFVDEDKVKDEFFDLVNDLETRFNYAAKNTSLPQTPDYKRVNEFVMDVNQRVILGEL